MPTVLQGYPEHIAATVAEWLMAFISSAYFLTFTGEFKVIRSKLIVEPKDSSHRASDSSVVITTQPTEQTHSNGHAPSEHSESIAGDSVDANGSVTKDGKEL